MEPFLNIKDHTHNTEIHLKDKGSIVRNQCEVAEILPDYFSTIAEGIGGKSAELRSMEDFEYHPCVQKIMAETTNLTQGIEVRPVTEIQVKDFLESLNINKATGCDGIPENLLKIGAKALARSLMTLFNSCIKQQGMAKRIECGDNEKINTTETLQLLGVTIDSKLNFNNHISIICKKKPVKLLVCL